jgi:hypothetical protein
MPVMVRVEKAGVVLHEGLRERVERFRRAEPGEFVAERRDSRAEIRRLADRRIGAVGGDDQIVILRVFRADVFFEFNGHPRLFQPAAQQLQEFQAPDRRETDAVDHYRRAAQHHGDVGPCFHRRGDALVGLGIVRAQEFERAFREHDAEAEGGIARVLLDDSHLPTGKLALHKIGQIQARGPRAGNKHPHGVIR